jgi:hypothetical protein
MGEKFVIDAAKKSAELDKVYGQVKSHVGDYGFGKVTELKTDVVKKAMDEAKKPAEFVAEYDFVNKTLIGQLVCDVKGKMRSVIGRSEIKSKEEFKKFKALASNKTLNKNFDEMGV